MIGQIVNIVADELNAYFRSFGREGLNNQQRVTLETLVNQEGRVSSSLNDSIVMSVINIEEDRVSRSWDKHRQRIDGRVEVLKPELKLNIYLLFVAYYPNTAQGNTTDNELYRQGLDDLALIIQFFQSRNVLDASNTPALPARVGKLIFEMNSLTFEQQNHLWGSLGAKYLPSVLYKMRLIVIRAEEPETAGPPIDKIQVNGRDLNA